MFCMLLLSVCVNVIQVLSFSIGDLKRMAEILYPEVHGNSSNSGRTNRSRLSHPLHREDPLYDAHDAQEQVRLLAKRATPQKAQQTQKTQKTHKNASHASSFTTNTAAAGGMPRTSVPPPPLPVRAVGTSSTAQNGVKDNHRTGAATSSSQNQNISSRRSVVQHSVSSSARPAAHSHQSNYQVGQNSGNESEMNALDRMLPNGSYSSRYAATLSSGAGSSAILIGMFDFALCTLYINVVVLTQSLCNLFVSIRHTSSSYLSQTLC